MPLQYSQDDDGLLHSLAVQQELDEILASPAGIAGYLRRIAALMSESGGDFDATVTLAAAALLEGERPAPTSPPLSDAEQRILEQFGHPREADGNEEYLARRVLTFPDTGSDNWWIASAITLAAAYLEKP